MNKFCVHILTYSFTCLFKDRLITNRTHLTFIAIAKKRVVSSNSVTVLKAPLLNDVGHGVRRCNIDLKRERRYKYM